MIDKYSENDAARNKIASASVDALMTLAENRDGELDGYELAIVHDSIVSACSKDADLDQREIANLLTLANSEAFDAHLRREAASRAALMLGLRE